MLFHLKLQNLWTMLGEELLHFIKFSVKVLLKGMESDQAKSMSSAHSGYKAMLVEVL